MTVQNQEFLQAMLLEAPEHVFHIARRLLEEYGVEEREYRHSLWGEAYHNLIKPITPWYARPPLDLATWADGLAWKRKQRRFRGRGAGPGKVIDATPDGKR